MENSKTTKAAHQKRLLSRLARVEGQIRAVKKMIESEAPCELIAQQLAASRSAINKAHYEMIVCAIDHEILLDTTIPEEKQAKLQELTRLLSKYG